MLQIDLNISLFVFSLLLITMVMIRFTNTMAKMHMLQIGHRYTVRSPISLFVAIDVEYYVW